MKYPHLIILYGRFGGKVHEKQQAMIGGKSVCGYRDYAKRFGEIIYLCPQDTNETWDRSISNPGELLTYLKTKPNSIVWSVKHDPTQQKDRILEQIPNKTVYYSCCSYHPTNSSCDISLVDTPERVKYYGALWVKGKDPVFWKPQGGKKVFDYCMIGKRGDKNEVWFIDQLTANVKESRNILWIGGLKHGHKIRQSHHNIACTPFSGPVGVRNYIDMCKVGVLLSEIPAEGMPQSLIEMLIMGLPVAYLGPVNDRYVIFGLVRLEDKQFSTGVAESLLESSHHTKQVRNVAAEKFSLEKSYESILKGLNYVS